MPEHIQPRTLRVSNARVDELARADLDARAIVSVTHTEPLSARDLVAISEQLAIDALTEVDELAGFVLTSEAYFAPADGHSLRRRTGWRHRLSPRRAVRRLRRRIDDRIHRDCYPY